MKDKFEKMIKELFEYTPPSVHTKNCEPFEQLNRKYISLQEQYANSYQELSEYIALNEIKRQYAKGGATIHRGFYSPSSLDLVVGGCSRGRLLKSATPEIAYDYEYVFDSKDDLICCRKYNSGIVSTEFIVYEQDRVLSLVYETDDHHLSFISECRYDGSKLLRYESALCAAPIGRKNCVEINVESLEYENGLMKSVLWQRYTPSLKLLTEEIYRFERDDGGYLSTYTVEQVGNSCAESEETTGPYKVLAKRR